MRQQHCQCKAEEILQTLPKLTSYNGNACHIVAVMGERATDAGCGPISSTGFGDAVHAQSLVELMGALHEQEWGPGRACEGLRLSQLTRCTSRGMGTTTSSPLADLSALNSGLMRMLMLACTHSTLPSSTCGCLGNAKYTQMPEEADAGVACMHSKLPWRTAVCFANAEGNKSYPGLQLAGSRGVGVDSDQDQLWERKSNALQTQKKP